jgi:hypothetical protein
MLIKREKYLSTANSFNAMRHRAAVASTPTYDGVSLDLGSSGLSKAGQVTNIVLGKKQRVKTPYLSQYMYKHCGKNARNIPPQMIHAAD